MQHRDDGFYYAKRLLSRAGDQGALYRDLCAINESLLTMDGSIGGRRYAMVFVQEHFLELLLSSGM